MKKQRLLSAGKIPTNQNCQLFGSDGRHLWFKLFKNYFFIFYSYVGAVLWTMLFTVLLTIIAYVMSERATGARYTNNFDMNYEGDTDQLNMQY